MIQLVDALQGLVDVEQEQSKAHALLLRIQAADGRIAFTGSAGAATPEAWFPISSISKMFTAALIRQLLDEGRIAFDQTVQSALPEIDLTGLHVVKGIDDGSRLTIRQLLFQTSGLADYYEGGVVEDVIQSKDYAYDLSDVLGWAKQRPLRGAGQRQGTLLRHQVPASGCHHRSGDGPVLW